MTVNEMADFLAKVPVYLRDIPVVQVGRVKGSHPEELLEIEDACVVTTRTYPAWGYYVEQPSTQFAPPDDCIIGAVLRLSVGP